jgi:hypothetical protein
MIGLSAWLTGNSERVWRHQDGSTPMRNPPDNSSEALAAFIAHKTAIDTILARLVALSGDRFNAMPEDVTWAHVGTLGSYLEALHQVSDAAFHEGEHAGGSTAVNSRPVPVQTGGALAGSGARWPGTASRSSHHG